MSELMFGPDPDWPDDGSEPAYKRIARELAAEIAAGRLADGAKLPSESQLCEVYDVSSITARAAISELKRRGLAVGVRRRGVFVRRPNVLTRVAPQRYWRGQEARTYVREAEASGVDVSKAHHSERTQASAEVAERLGIDPGDRVMQTTYLISMGGRPVTSSVCWEPLELTEGTPIEWPDEGPMAGEGIVARFDSIGHHASRVEESLTIRQPTPEECERLDLPTDVPVVVIEQVFRAGLDEDLALEAAEIIYPSDRYRFRYDMEIK